MKKVSYIYNSNAIIMGERPLSSDTRLRCRYYFNSCFHFGCKYSIFSNICAIFGENSGALARKKKNKKILTPDFLRKDKTRYLRLYGKTIRFNRMELEYIDEYCKKYNVHSKAAFFRDCIIGTVMKELDQNYPRLF